MGFASKHITVFAMIPEIANIAQQKDQIKPNQYHQRQSVLVALPI
jgi:hypothetical protein